MFQAYFVKVYLTNLILFLDAKKNEYTVANSGTERPPFDMSSYTLAWFDAQSSPVLNSILATQGELFFRNLQTEFIKRGREMAAANEIHYLTEAEVLNWLK